MPVIKRYPNRKLYDTAAKQYVSLEGVAEMIRRGEPVQVLDHTTGEDHTTLILTQIIVEQEKRGTGFLPLDVLTGLVEAGGNTLATLRQRLSAPLDLLHQVDDEIQARVDKLVSLGELAEDEGRRLAQRLLALGAAVRSDRVAQEEALERALQARNVPTRADIERLSQVIDQLTAEVDSLKRSQ
jgi:polyhydroxyalkanoate synthesis repressor PhaR